jgi:hypothetical protein
MKIISTTDLSREGNDCYIYESVSLVEAFGMYTVITCQKVVGWREHRDIYCRSNPTTDIDEAKHIYWEYGGNLNAIQE